MDKSQVRSCINETFPVGYDPLTGNIFIDTTGASLGDTLVNTSSGVVWQPASGGGGAVWGGITGTLSDQTDLQSALDALVPYTGATNDVDLDTFSLNAKSLHVKGTGGAGHLGLKHQSANATANANETAIFADSNGDLKTKNDALYYSTFKTSLNTADRTYTFPDASGTLALTNQLPTPAALTKVDDTNVTLTLGGTPATALLQATSLTLGWTGQLAISRGGTGGNLYAGWDLITTSVASSSATIDFTGLSSTYKNYCVVFYDVIPATNSTTFRVRVGTGGTPTYDTGNNYGWSYAYRQGSTTVGGSIGGNGAFTDNAVSLGNNTLSNNANRPISGRLWLYNPSQSTTYHYMDSVFNYQNDSAALITGVDEMGVYKSTTAITALRFFMASGNISSGTFQLYGIR